MGKAQSTVSEVLRRAILDAPESRNRIAAATGVEASQLSRFVHRQQGIGLTTADKLCEYLGLTLVRKEREHGKRD